MSERKRIILSIDGGGMRGLIPLRILEALESRLRQRGKDAPLHRYIDLIAGTSTGGLIAAGLAAPKPEARAGSPAADVASLRCFFEVDAREIFARQHPLKRMLSGPFGFFDEKYDERLLEKALKSLFGWTSLASSMTRVLLPVYDIGAMRPMFMSNGGAEQHASADDYYVWEAVRAAMATPALFEPARVENLVKGESQVAVDGSLFAANPVLNAYMEARANGWDAADIVVLSLGVGADRAQGHPFSSVVKWGAHEWMSSKHDQPLLSAVENGQSANMQEQARWMLGETASRYIRLDGSLPAGAEALDNTRPSNIIVLNGVADRIIRDHTTTLDEIADIMQERLD